MKNWKKYLTLLLAGFTGYALGLVALNLFYDKTSEYRYLLILLPMVPMLYTVTVFLRGASELDEMQRRIMTEAMAFAGLATGITCFSYLFLRDMGAPEFKAWWTWNILCTYYIVGIAWAKWQYR